MMNGMLQTAQVEMLSRRGLHAPKIASARCFFVGSRKGSTQPTNAALGAALQLQRRLCADHSRPSLGERHR